VNANVKKAAEPRSARSEVRRSLIVAAAVDQFMHYGLRSASLEEIARAAGVSRPALYHHFPSKEELFREAARSMHEGVLSLVEEAVHKPISVARRLHEIMRIKAEKMHEAMWQSRHGVELFDESNRLGHDLATDYRRKFTLKLASVVEAGVAEKSLDLGALGLDPAKAGAYLFFSSEGLHERFTGTPVAPNVYRKRLAVLIDSFLAATAPKDA
jgi:AcrR family transcriptional regulator